MRTMISNAKKMMVSLLVAAIAFASMGVIGASAAAQPKIVSSDMPIEVLIDARRIKSDVKPLVKSGVTLVELRSIAESLGGKLDYAQATGEVTITKGDRVVRLTIGKKEASRNGQPVQLAVPAEAKNGRTLVPARFISEALGVNVEYDETTRYVWIGSQEVPEIQDVMKPVDIQPYVKYYKGGEDLMENFSDEPKTQAYILNQDSFPLKIRKVIYYRFDLAKDDKNDTYIKATSNITGGIAASIEFLFDGKPAILGGEFIPVRGALNEQQVRAVYFPLVTYKRSVALKDIHYFGLRTDLAEVVLLQSPWR